MTIVRVYTDVGAVKPVHLLAKIFETKGETLCVRYLTKTDEHKNGIPIYRYEDEMYEIGDESISQYMETSDEEDIGYKKIDDGGFILEESDSDYDPDEDQGDEDDSESYVSSSDEDDADDEDEDNDDVGYTDDE